MSFCNSHKLFIFTLFFPVFILPVIISHPVSNLTYENFIAFLIKNNCSMPKELQLPFTKTSDPSPFSYLSAPLSECQKPEVTKEFDETHMLCTEVFDVLKNVTCGRYESLPTIESSHLSTNVCHDFANLKYNLPKKDDYLSGRLSDKVICKVLCTAEKYESLCKTLLWSYETLMKIDIALSSKDHEKEFGNIPKVTPAEESNVCQTNEFRCNDEQCISIQLKCDNKYDCPDGSDEIGCVTSSVKSNPTGVESQTSSQITKEPDKSKTVDNLQSDEHKTVVSNVDQTDQKPHNPGDVLQDVASKKDSPDRNIQDEAINKTAIESISTSQNKSEPNNQKLFPEITGNSVKPHESEKIPSLNPQPEHIDDNENKNDVSEELPKKEANDNNSQTHLDTVNLTPDVNRVNDDQKMKNVTLNNMLSKNDKADINSKIDAKSSGKTEKESIVPTTVIESDNELKSNNFPEEDSKPKTKQIDLDSQEVKENEKPKQTDYESPNELMPDKDSKLPEPSTQSLPDEDVEHQEDKDSDQYNDIGNEGDYAKSDYDNSFKNKESDVKSSIAAGTNQMINDFENNISPQSNIGRISEEIAMIAPYPEQEDSHFFFYFLTIVLIIMAGYLVFHNKQKIIALIVEGRHERRRRSHGAGYKKLETK